MIQVHNSIQQSDIDRGLYIYMITPGKYLNKKLTRFHIKVIGFF